MFTCKCKTWSIRNCKRCALPQLHFVNWNDSSGVVSTISFFVLAKTNCCSFHYVGGAAQRSHIMYMKTYIVVRVQSTHGVRLADAKFKFNLKAVACARYPFGYVIHSISRVLFVFSSTFYLLSFYEHTTNRPLSMVCVRGVEHAHSARLLAISIGPSVCTIFQLICLQTQHKQFRMI